MEPRMNRGFHLVLAATLVGTTLSIACGGSSDSLDDFDNATQRNGTGTGDGSGTGGGTGTGGGAGAGAGNGTGGGTGTGSGAITPTPGVSNTGAKAYYASTVHAALSPTCGTCHGAAGPGPAWFFTAEIDKTYTTLENLGYMAKPSRLQTKGVHNGGTAPALTADQITKLNTWIDMELAARGNKAPVNIKEKLGSCFDQKLFDAIGLKDLRTTRRNNENANNCTGCNNSPCMTCHSSDPATGVIIAYGNNNLPANYTFEMAKDVPFMDLVIGTNGTDLVGAKKLQVKSDATKKDKPYTHPMYSMPANMQAAIDAFAADVATKYKAGQCQ